MLNFIADSFKRSVYFISESVGVSVCLTVCRSLQKGVRLRLIFIAGSG